MAYCWTLAIKMSLTETFPVVQWLTLRAPDGGGPGLIPGQGTRGFLGGSAVENLPLNAGDTGLIETTPWSRKWQSAPAFSPGKPMYRGARRATVPRVAKKLATTDRLNNSKRELNPACHNLKEPACCTKTWHSQNK